MPSLSRLPASTPAAIEPHRRVDNPSHCGSPTLYLHVGLHKTGTTAFQRAAACAADSQPLLYPHFDKRTEGDFSHNILVGYMQTHRATCRKNPAACDPGVPATHEMRMLRELFQERWRTATVLLSAEEFARELVHDDRARQWQDLCSGFPTVRVALVLRRFDHLRNSVASEKSTTSFHGNLLSGPRGWGYVCYDVSALLRLASSFGWRVDIFSYDRLTAEGTLVQELGNWCGLVTDGLPSASIKTRANAKFHRRKTLFCSLLDKTQLSVGQREGLVRSLDRSSAIADDGVEFLYSPQELDAFYASTKRLNAAALMAAGIHDIDEFFNYRPLEPDTRWIPPRLPTAAEIATARADILVDTGIDIAALCLDPAQTYASESIS